MTGPFLSICIPTYNFGKFIGDTLESIVCQITDDVEVVVLDGASTDNTSEVVREYQKIHSNIKYYQQDKKGGIDRDMAKSVELANGKYCWLFSADDVMKEHAIGKILSLVKQGHDLYLCKHTNCRLNMTYLNEHPVLKRDKKLEFNLSDPMDRKHYFELAHTTEAFFSFMGGIIIKKSKWDSIPINEKFVGSCWCHVARIFELIPKGLILKYIPEPLLDRRGDNDSFADRGIVNRFGIAIDGYHKIGDVFFGHNSLEAYHMRRVIRYELNLCCFLHAKYLCWKDPCREDVNLLNLLFRKAYEDFSFPVFFKHIIYRLIPGRMLYAMRNVKKTFMP
jgi:abequosyltransferase